MTIHWVSILHELDRVGGPRFENVEQLLEYLYVTLKYSLREIGAIYDCDKRTVARRLQKAGITLRPRGGPNHKSKIFIPDEEFATMNMKQIAYRHRCCLSTVYKKYHQYLAKKREGKQ